MYLALAYLLKLTAPKQYYGVEPKRPTEKASGPRTRGFWDRWL